MQVGSILQAHGMGYGGLSIEAAKFSDYRREPVSMPDNDTDPQPLAPLLPNSRGLGPRFGLIATRVRDTSYSPKAASLLAL